MTTISRQRLHELLHYNPKTGIFTWLPRPVRRGYERTDRAWNSKHAGTQAGSAREDRCGRFYLRIRISGKTYNAHRLAFLYMTGAFPPEQIDHKDRDGLNNCWQNLRAASRTENCANRGARTGNKCGLKGVSFHKRIGRYCAEIRAHGKRHYLGYFDTPEDAHAAYVAAAEEYFGEFARAA